MPKPIPLFRVAWLLALVMLGGAGCEPSRTPPVSLMAMVLSNRGNYEPAQVALSTMTDVVGVKGTVMATVGGARIVVNDQDPLLASNGGNLTDEQLAQVFIKNSGGPPRASYIERAGVLWPADFHTWNMVTSYYNFEQAFLYWQEIGVPAQEMTQVTLYYFPYFEITSQSPYAIEDNALFFSPVQAFMVLPFKDLQTVPLPMNFGVIAHEYSHRIFNRRVYGGRSFPAPITVWSSMGGPSPGLNLLKSVDEGLADWNAFGATCRTPFGCSTRFLGASLSSGDTDRRDMAKNDKCLTDDIRLPLFESPISDFSSSGKEYRVGTIIASVLWHAAEKTGQRGVLQRAVLAAYNDENPATPGLAQIIDQNLNTPTNFSPAVMANAIMTHITDLELRKEVCNGFIDQMKIAKDQMPACPASAAGNNPALCP